MGWRVGWERERESVCVYVSEWVRLSVYLCLCVCVCFGVCKRELVRGGGRGRVESMKRAKLCPVHEDELLKLSVGSVVTL